MTELRRRLIASVVLVAVAAALTAVAYRMSVTFAEVSEEQEPGARMSMALQGDKARALTFTRGNRSIVLKRENAVDGMWTVQQPKGARTNQHTVNAAIDALGHMRFLRQLTFGAQEFGAVSSRLGLEQPRFEWQVKTSDDQWTVRFGAHPPDVKAATYVQIGGKSPMSSMIFVVVAQESLLDVDPENITADTFDGTVGDIESIEIGSGNAQTIIRALHDSRTHKWRDAATGIRLDRLRVEEILAEVTRAASETRRSRSQDAAVADAVLTLRIGRKSAATTVIEIRAGCEGSSTLAELQFSDAPDGVFCAPLAPLKEAALRPAHEWYDLGLFSLELDEVESAQAKEHTNTFSIERDEISFVASGAGSQRVSLDTGNDLLLALCSLSGHTLDHSDRSAFQEHASISLRTSVVGDGFQETVLIGDIDPDGGLRVLRLEDNAVLQMQPKDAEQLRAQLSRLATLARAE